ncbi:expressed unknown protein [Seminavis robusta]|uniref:Uncharacterized protein n=1 Tax=Seminavis robusta TaxID=568900 RepID=A0A9N8HCJ4_9STRA|nr:expressed unknown protein [Seminavis robusta]|eukprot:Sro385_g131600.1 n/a (303) ;mRNA; f:10459-11367
MYGRHIRRLYDFVRSYSIEGILYQADHNIYDNLLAASRGSIDGVCLDASFVQEEEWYSISHEIFPTHGSVDLERMLQANVIYINSGSFSAEYYREAEPTLFTGHSLMRIVMRMVKEVPQSLYTLVPGLSHTGTVRRLIHGTFSTAVVPQPLLAPEDPIEGLQIDVAADKMKLALQNGLFTGNDQVPPYFFAMIKPLPASDNPHSCWQGPTVTLDIQAPMGWGAQLDMFVNLVVYRHLVAVNATVTMHFGKRLPPNSKVLAAALERYHECGAEVDVDADPCYHPMCKRTVVPTEFEYPPAYYA